jgi:amidase
VNKAGPISVYSYWQLNKQKVAAQKRFLDLWNSTRSETSRKQIDILLAPVMPHSAVPHRKCRWVGYTKVFNVVDYPVVVIPAGEVSKELDGASKMNSYRPRNPLDEWNWNLFDPITMDGMPIGLQVVARRLQEETALGAARSIGPDLAGCTYNPRHMMQSGTTWSLRRMRHDFLHLSEISLYCKLICSSLSKLQIRILL